MESVFRYRSQEITAAQVEFIRQLIRAHPEATRRRLSLVLCETWGWKQANGAPRDMVCRGLLLGLHRAGHIALPPAKQQGFNPAMRYRGARWQAGAVVVDTTPLAVPLRALRPLEFRLVRRAPDEALFNTLIEQYHPLRCLIETIGEKNTTISQLRALLSKPSTEKTSKVLEQAGIKAKGSSPPNNKPKPGHGRNGARAYGGARRIQIARGSLRPGDRCPECLKGKVYEQKNPGLRIRVVGQAPIAATVHELERLRCNRCGEGFEAEAPEEVGEKKYDATARAMIALLKYGSGVPFYRLEGLEGSLGIPLPPSSQWEIVAETADVIRPVFDELIRQAAQGEVFYNDDPSMKILARASPRRVEEEEGSSARERTGLFTSGIVSRTRQGRRFVEVTPNFPQECRFVLESFRDVYRYDAEAEAQGLAPEERLRFHQEHSQPVMDALHAWFLAQFAEKKVEPNSGLGEAITYCLKRWDRLTLFLREAGAPLDSNLVERALKRCILHRKNSLFYKTENGAEVGDLFMSLIHTCELNNANPFDYLTELEKHAEELAEHPAAWMPWNYRQTLSQVPRSDDPI